MLWIMMAGVAWLAIATLVAVRIGRALRKAERRPPPPYLGSWGQSDLPPAPAPRKPSAAAPEDPG